MPDLYDVLTAELRDDPLGIGYAAMTDAEVAAALNAKTRTRVITRFVSLRAIATVLDDQEYAVFRQALESAAQQSLRVADMVRFVQMPCDDSGTTGGIDMGHEAVRSFIHSLCGAMPDHELGTRIARKLLALAEVPCSRLEELGVTEIVNEHHVASARRMLGS